MKTINDLTGLDLVVAQNIEYEIYLEISDEPDDAISKGIAYAESQIFGDVLKLNQRLKSACKRHDIPLPDGMVGVVERDPATNDEYILNRLHWNGQEWIHHSVRLPLRFMRFR